MQIIWPERTWITPQLILLVVLNYNHQVSGMGTVELDLRQKFGSIGWVVVEPPPPLPQAVKANKHTIPISFFLHKLSLRKK